MKVGADDGWLGMLRGRDGLKRSSEALETAASDVVSASVRVLNGSPADPVDRVTIRHPVDLDDALLDAKRAEHAYAANARTVQVSDETFESMLDMVLPHNARSRES